MSKTRYAYNGESRIAYEQLLTRLANIRLAPGKNDFAVLPSPIFRAIAEVWVEFDPGPRLDGAARDAGDLAANVR